MVVEEEQGGEGEREGRGMRSEEEVRNYLKKLEADIKTYERELKNSIAEKRLLKWILGEGE